MASGSSRLDALHWGCAAGLWAAAHLPPRSLHKARGLAERDAGETGEGRGGGKEPVKKVAEGTRVTFNLKIRMRKVHYG